MNAIGLQTGNPVPGQHKDGLTVDHAQAQSQLGKGCQGNVTQGVQDGGCVGCLQCRRAQSWSGALSWDPVILDPICLGCAATLDRSVVRVSACRRWTCLKMGQDCESTLEREVGHHQTHAIICGRRGLFCNAHPAPSVMLTRDTNWTGKQGIKGRFNLGNMQTLRHQ